MKRLFLSWSGEPSRTVAHALRGWLPRVVHELDPWVSNQDIRPGEQWSSEVAQALEATEFGIVCVTESNQGSAWLNFEAGALAKALGPGRLFPYLILLHPNEVKGPLAQFQAVSADNEGTFSLLRTLNRLTDPQLTDEEITTAFEKWWPDLAAILEQLPEVSRDIEASGRGWPLVKTANTLQLCIASLSATQRRILREAVKADGRINADVLRGFLSPEDRNEGPQFGLYLSQLEQLFGLSRGELVYRCKDLERLDLMLIAEVTEQRFHPTQSVVNLINRQPAEILGSLFLDKDKTNE